MSKYGRFKADEFAASKDGCDVRIGDYHFTGDLHEYHITGKAEDLSAEVRLESVTEPWRPETGHLVFGADGDTIFAWAAFVPMGKVTATYRIGTEVHETTGMGYHDHNWMNLGMAHLIDHWYWGRGQVVRTRTSPPSSRRPRSTATPSSPTTCWRVTARSSPTTAPR